MNIFFFVIMMLSAGLLQLWVGSWPLLLPLTAYAAAYLLLRTERTLAWVAGIASGLMLDCFYQTGGLFYTLMNFVAVGFLDFYRGRHDLRPAVLLLIPGSIIGGGFQLGAFFWYWMQMGSLRHWAWHETLFFVLEKLAQSLIAGGVFFGWILLMDALAESLDLSFRPRGNRRTRSPIG